jgi:hypothetical protein
MPAGARGLNPPGSVPPNEVFSYFVFDRLNQCSNTVPRELPARVITYDSAFIDLYGLVLDLDVNLSITHSNDEDLYIWLSRSGIPNTELSTNNGGNGANYINTTFDDEAEIPITQGTAPFTGIFKPQQLLSVYDETELHGTWKLRVLNYSYALSGQLVNWCMNFSVYDPIAIHNSQVPVSMILKQNYPNPFNASTSINYSLVRQSDVKISIYDILGREVKTLVNKNLTAGNYVLSFNAGDMASGLYFYSMFIDGVLFETKKMVLVK